MTLFADLFVNFRCLYKIYLVTMFFLCCLNVVCFGSIWLPFWLHFHAFGLHLGSFFDDFWLILVSGGSFGRPFLTLGASRQPEGPQRRDFIDFWWDFGSILEVIFGVFSYIFLLHFCIWIFIVFLSLCWWFFEDFLINFSSFVDVFSKPFSITFFEWFSESFFIKKTCFLH